jgi:hypothetical protein
MGADSACLYIAALSERDLLLWPVHDAVLRAVTTGRREVAALLAPAIAARSEHIGDAPDPHELAGSDASPASGVPAPDRDPTRRSLTGSLPPAQLPAFDRKRICGRVGLPLGERFSAGAGCDLGALPLGRHLHQPVHQLCSRPVSDLQPSDEQRVATASAERDALLVVLLKSQGEPGADLIGEDRL